MSFLERLRRNEACFANEGMKRFAMKPRLKGANYGKNPPKVGFNKVLRTEIGYVLAEISILE